MQEKYKFYTTDDDFWVRGTQFMPIDVFCETGRHWYVVEVGHSLDYASAECSACMFKDMHERYQVALAEEAKKINAAEAL